MSSEQPSEGQGQPGTVRNQKGLIAGGAGVAVLVLIAIVLSLGDDGGQVAAPASTTAPPPPLTTTTIPGPLVPPIDGCTLLTNLEVEEAMGLLDAEGQPTSSGLLSISGGEGCRWQPTESAQDLGVELGPGDQSDFAEGATLADAVGEPVTDIGDLAVWFGGDNQGVLSVVEGTPKGYLFVRVAMSRRDVDDSTRLEIVKGLAAKAMERIQFEPPPPVEADLCELVTEDEAEVILAPHREGRAAARDQVMTIENLSEPVDLSQPGDFFCQRLILTEIYLTIESGDAADFEPGAELEGISGEPVPGVGEEALWFAPIPTSGSFASPHEVGMLAVHGNDAYFRIRLALPDLDFAEQLDIAKGLASTALARISGGDVTITNVEHETPDVSDLGFVENLLAKEEAGEWTRGEGLVATLRLFVGEVDQSQVLRQPELVDYSGTGIIRLARQYLATGEDDAVKTEIVRLLDLLMLAPGWDAPIAEVSPLTVSLGNGYFSPGLVAQEEQSEGDGDDGYAPPPDDSTTDKYAPPSELPSTEAFEACANSEPEMPGWTPSAYEVEGFGPWKYVVYFPVEGSEGGWNRETHLLWALEALTDSVGTYGGANDPCIGVLFSHHGGSYTYVLDTNSYGSCAVIINTPMQTRNPGHFKQQLAADLAHCVIPYNFPGQFEVASYLNRRWWNHALAEYLSNEVYPAVSCGGQRCDLEWRLASTLAAQELAVPLAYRDAPNWLFFQYIVSEVGYEGMEGIFKTLPPSSDPTEHENALASVSGMDAMFHGFAKALSDGSVSDKGGGDVPYQPNRQTIPISGRHIIFEDPEMFGTTRLHLKIDPGRYACIESSKDGQVLASFRPGSPGKQGVGGGWQSLPEDEDVYSGELVVVATATGRDASFTVNVTNVNDDPECEEEEEEETTPTTVSDLDCCGPTAFYKYGEQLGEWLQAVLPPIGG